MREPIQISSGTLTVNQRVWDSTSLSWVAATQPLLEAGTVNLQGYSTQVAVSNFPTTYSVTGAALTDISTNTARIALTPASGEVSGLGNNTLVTPTGGKKLRLAYVSYNPALAVEAGFRLGSSGTLFLRNSLTAGGAVVAKDFGDMRYVEGAIDAPLVLNLSLGVSVIWNALYVEV